MGCYDQDGNCVDDDEVFEQGFKIGELVGKKDFCDQLIRQLVAAQWAYGCMQETEMGHQTLAEVREVKRTTPRWAWLSARGDDRAAHEVVAEMLGGVTNG